MTHVTGLLQQDYFRIRNDDGSETSATWIAAENTNASVLYDTTFRIRFVIDEVAGGSANAGFNFYFSRNSGAYTQITTASAARFVTSANVTDGELTTKQLTGGTGTFSSGVIESAGNGTGNVSIGANGHTELEIVVQLNSGTFVAGDTCAFRIYLDTGAEISAYTATPTITAQAPVQTYNDSIVLNQSKTNDLSKALTIFRDYNLNISNTLENSAFLDALRSLVLSNENNIDCSNSFNILFVNYLIEHSLSINNFSGLLLTVIFELSKTYSIAELASILPPAGVYLSVIQDLSGARQKQTVETWNDTQVTWTAVQGTLPLDTPLEHAIVTFSGNIAWSP